MSPYVADAPEIKLNEVNLQKIKSEEASVGTDFKIAVISDTHNYYDELENVIDTINSNGPYSFVIVTGDVSNYGLLEEYDQTRRLLNTLKFPFIVLIGNHDSLANGKIIFKRMYGEYDFSFQYKNVDFVFLNNNNWESGGPVPDVEWLKTTLQASSAPFKVLFTHVSVEDKDRFTPAQTQEMASIVASYGINLLFNGHDHNSGETAFAGVSRITVGSLFKSKYSELIVTATGVSHQKKDF